jgi:hypothetical protein
MDYDSLCKHILNVDPKVRFAGICDDNDFISSSVAPELSIAYSVYIYALITQYCGGFLSKQLMQFQQQRRKGEKQ